MGPKYRRECLPNETVLNLGKRKSEFLKLKHESRGLKMAVMVSEHILVCLTLYISTHITVLKTSVQQCWQVSRIQ